MIWIIIIAVITILDRVTKYLVVKGVEQGDAITVINNVFYIAHARNPGAALGILPKGRYFFIAMTFIISVALVYILLCKSNNTLQKVSLAFIVGGAAGNLIDRIFIGSVTDFLDFYIGSFHFWTFNFADLFVVTGTILLAIYLIFFYDNKQNKIVLPDKSQE